MAVKPEAAESSAAGARNGLKSQTNGTALNYELPWQVTSLLRHRTSQKCIISKPQLHRTPSNTSPTGSKNTAQPSYPK